MYTKFCGEPRRKRSLGGPRRTYEDNIKVDIRKIGWGGMDLINLAQDETSGQLL
jgi:hypothetical protein